MDYPDADAPKPRSPSHLSPTPAASEAHQPAQSEIATVLQSASEGLLWMSESDYPWDVLVWPHGSTATLTDADVLQQTGHDPNTPIAQTDWARFFEAACQVQAWHNETEIVMVQRYQALVEILQTHLTDLRVYRVGEIEVDIYVLGITADGTIAGLATKAIET